MNTKKILNIRNAIALFGIASLAKIVLFGLVVLGIKFLYQPLPADGYSNYLLFCSLIIDFVTIIFAVKFFNVDIRKQFIKIRQITFVLFCLLTILLFLLVIPLVNPLDFFDKLVNLQLSVHQFDFTIFEKPDFNHTFYFFLMVVITPIIEETLYRGIIFNLFLKKYSVKISFIVSSLIFAFFHLRFTGIGYLFLYGLLFGFAYYKTKSLITPILIHVLINLMAVTTSHQYIELNSATLPKYFLYTAVLLTGAYIVFNSLNKGTNSIKFETKILTQKSKMPCPKTNEESFD